MATFIGAGVILEAWDQYQVDGWPGVIPLVGAFLVGSLAGFGVEMLDTALETRARMASTVFRVGLGLAGLTLAFIGLAGVWDSDGGHLVPLPVLAGVGLTRLTVWMWHRRPSRAAARP